MVDGKPPPLPLEVGRRILLSITIAAPSRLE
jgi:hypothetical protein